MDVTGLGFAVVAEARTLADGILTQIDNYGQGPGKFQTLGTNLKRLTENIDDVNGILVSSPGTLPTRIEGIFDRTFSHVKDILKNSSDVVENDISKAFPGPSSGFVSKVKSKFHRVTRATSLNQKMNFVETQIKDASDQLAHLTTVLSNALKADEQQGAILPTIETMRVAESSKEEYRPGTSAPAVSHNIKLDFESKDAEGEFATPEGSLKHKVLSCMSSEAVTAAAGALNPAYGLVGMAGVGKTIALQGLASDEDICKRFPDGIHYMSLGQGATVAAAIEEIAYVMTMTGAAASVAKVENSTPLRKAVAYACTWFQGKKCLFLIDDLWPTDGCPTGHLAELQQLLRQSPDSRMAISTRSVNIALGAGCVVDFDAREPMGAVSVGIFMKYATGSMTLNVAPQVSDSLSPSMSKILAWCGGLPIALSVTGSAIALLLRNVGSLERACNIYVTDFEERATNLGERLRDGILLSLKYLQAEFSNWKERNGVDVAYTILDLYASLCILSNQLWVPVSALSRMWKLEEKLSMDIMDLFCGMSLATRSFRKAGEEVAEKAGLTLHDLHLEFCKSEAKSKNSEAFWHSALLSGYLESSVDFDSFDVSKLSSQQLLRLSPRSWWAATVPEDGYIHGNLARHLALSSHGSELAALLFDARWANVRGKLGGILGLNADFAILDKLLWAGDGGGEGQFPSKGIEKTQAMGKAVQQLQTGDNRRQLRDASRLIQESAKLVLKAMQLSWGSFIDGQRAFYFQMCGRLMSLRETNVIVDAVMKSFEAHTPKPHLVPVTNFFPELNSAQIWETPVGGHCFSVACSPCGRYIAAGGGPDIVIADSITGDVLQRLKGHSEHVRFIQFTQGSKKIVSASADETVAMWEWEQSGAPILVLEGHRDLVRGVAVSRDGECIFSVSYDRTLRFWNGTTGLQSFEFEQCSTVFCVALCPDDRKVAIGLNNGTVKVLDCCTGGVLFEDNEAHTQAVLSLAFSPDGQLLVTCSEDRTIRLWNAETWEAIGSPVQGHTNWVMSVAFSPDGQQLVSGSYDRTVRLWGVTPLGSVGTSSNTSVLSERNVFSSDAVTSVTFTCDGKRIVSGSYGGIFRILDAEFLSEETQESFGHELPVFGVSISPDGLLVASGSMDMTVCLWNTQTGAQIGIPLEGHTGDVNCVSFSPDGRYLVSGSDDKTLRMWDTETLTQIGNVFEGHSDRVNCVSFSADGLRIVSGGYDKTVRLWNAETREQVGETLIGHANWVRYISESSDGRFVVSRDWDAKEDERETII